MLKLSRHHRQAHTYVQADIYIRMHVQVYCVDVGGCMHRYPCTIHTQIGTDTRIRICRDRGREREREARQISTVLVCSLNQEDKRTSEQERRLFLSRP